MSSDNNNSECGIFCYQSYWRVSTLLCETRYFARRGFHRSVTRLERISQSWSNTECVRVQAGGFQTSRGIVSVHFDFTYIGSQSEKLWFVDISFTTTIVFKNCFVIAKDWQYVFLRCTHVDFTSRVNGWRWSQTRCFRALEVCIPSINLFVCPEFPQLKWRFFSMPSIRWSSWRLTIDAASIICQHALCTRDLWNLSPFKCSESTHRCT